MCMIKKFLSLSGIFIGCTSSFIILPVNAAKDPYIYAYVSFAINYCAREYGIFRDSEAYENWQNGELIQDALFMLSADEREMLMSGTCGECFDKLFPDQDEDIEEEF